MENKLSDELHPQGIYSDTNQDLKNVKRSGKKLIKDDGRITLKAHAHLQTMIKTSAKFQKVWYKTVSGVAQISYPCDDIVSQLKKKLDKLPM